MADKVTSERGIELVKKYEGLMKTIYYCPGQVLSGGWGHAIVGKERASYNLGDPISMEIINKWFSEDIKKAEKIVNNWVTKEITQPQFDALVSFVYNLGPDNFKRSTLLKRINKGQFELSLKEFPKWVHSKGKVLPGLVKRRAEEARLFKEGIKEMAEELV